MKKILFLALYINLVCVYAQEEATFSKANELYNQEKYQEAIDAYQSILDAGKESAAVYYNMANSYYKLSTIGPSIYYYEKALQLAPNDADVKNNLAYAKNATVDQIDIIPEGFMSKTIGNITGLFTFDGWAWASAIGMILFVVLFICYYMAIMTLQKRLFFIAAIGLLCFSLLGVCFSYAQYNTKRDTQFAIIFAQETLIKSEPNLKSEEVFELHQGTKVQVTETINNWKKIKLADGKIGWIPAADLKEL